MGRTCFLLQMRTPPRWCNLPGVLESSCEEGRFHLKSSDSASTASYARTSCLSVFRILSVMNVNVRGTNLCKHFCSHEMCHTTIPCHLRATSSIRLVFTVESKTFPLPLPLFPSFLYFRRKLMYCSKEAFLLMALLHFSI